VKVLFVFTHILHGGSETYLLRILDGIDKKKISPIVAVSSRNKRLVENLQKRKITYVTLPEINLLWKNKIAKIFIQFPDFLLLNFIMGWLIIRYRPQIVHAAIFYSALFSVVPAKLWRCRFMWAVLAEPDLTAYPALTSFIMRHADKTVSVCRHLVDVAREKGLPGTEKMQVIYTGLTDDRFENYTDQPALEINGFLIKRPIVGLIARYDEYQKGHIYFWKMASIIHQKMPDVNFVVAGAPGNEIEKHFQERLKKMAVEIGVEKNLFLVGFIKENGISDFLSQIDILVVPSTHEGAPVVVQEASARSKPVVAFSVGGVPELIRDGETGFLVSPRDTETLAQKVYLLLDRPSIAKNMGGQGKKFAYFYFRERQFIDAYEKLYFSLIEL
jgi:glycosyltransferase involved in cell wall biosynthesis